MTTGRINQIAGPSRRRTLGRVLASFAYFEGRRSQKLRISFGVARVVEGLWTTGEGASPR